MNTLKTVWKFPLETARYQIIKIPRGAKLLTAAHQQGHGLQIWALVDSSEQLVGRQIHIRGTGHQVEPGLEHIGTYQILEGRIVFHVFDGGEEGDFCPTCHSSVRNTRVVHTSMGGACSDRWHDDG